MKPQDIQSLITDLQSVRQRADKLSALSPAYQKMMIAIIKSLLLKKAKLEAEQ
jgi:hypothetical protein